MATEWFNAGRVSPVPCGTWDERAEYKRLDVVTSPAGNASYIAKRDVPAGTLLTDETYWSALLDITEHVDAANQAADRANEAADRLEGTGGGSGGGGSGSGASPDQIAQIEQNRLDIVDIKEIMTVTDGYELTGNPVSVELTAELPINVVTHIRPIQQGSGDPAPTNIRPITGFDSATLTHNDATYTRYFGQTVYGGSLDWNTGVLTIDKKCITLDGNPNVLWKITTSGKAIFTEEYISGAKIVGTYDIVGISSHVHVSETTGALERLLLMCAYSGGKGLQMSTADYFGISPLTIDNWNAYLAGQYAAGTPVQVCYELANPITVQLTPCEIFSVLGVNTLSCDVGDITVSGRTDIWWKVDYLSGIIDKLRDAIISLGGNV